MDFLETLSKKKLTDFSKAKDEKNILTRTQMQ